MSKASMKIRFDGDSHQIDANTLINYLIHYQAVVEESNRVVGNGDKKVTVRINAVSKGSFVVDVELVESFFRTVFSSDSMGYASSVCAVVGSVYGAYKIFKGRKATAEEVGKAVNIEGNVLNQVVNIYNGPVVREAISKSFATVEADESVSGVSLESECGSVNFERSSFAEMQYDGFRQEGETFESREVEVEAKLTVLALAFEPGSKWGFSYNGMKISMPVKNDALSKAIDNGARFGKGDVLRVKMRIIQKYIAEAHAYQDASFRIVEFYEHIPAATQTSLNLSMDTDS